jgi:hypothetical protein
MEQEVIKYSPFNPQSVEILLMPYYNSIFLLHIHNTQWYVFHKRKYTLITNINYKAIMESLGGNNVTMALIPNA